MLCHSHLSLFLSFFLWYQREDKLLKTQSTKIQGDFSRETPERGKKDGIPPFLCLSGSDLAQKNPTNMQKMINPVNEVNV